MFFKQLTALPDLVWFRGDKSCPLANSHFSSKCQVSTQKTQMHSSKKWEPNRTWKYLWQPTQCMWKSPFSTFSILVQSLHWLLTLMRSQNHDLRIKDHTTIFRVPQRGDYLHHEKKKFSSLIKRNLKPGELFLLIFTWSTSAPVQEVRFQLRQL